MPTPLAVDIRVKLSDIPNRQVVNSTLGGRFLIRVESEVLPRQKHVDLLEGRTLPSVLVPAFDHQVVDLLGAPRRLRETQVKSVRLVIVAAVVDHLLIGQVFEWHRSGTGEDLPHCDAKRPDVAPARKVSLKAEMQFDAR